jgi:hypothetical protein
VAAASMGTSIRACAGVVKWTGGNAAVCPHYNRITCTHSQNWLQFLGVPSTQKRTREFAPAPLDRAGIGWPRAGDAPPMKNLVDNDDRGVVLARVRARRAFVLVWCHA